MGALAMLRFPRHVAKVLIVSAAVVFALLDADAGRALAQQQGILIAGATPTNPVQLLRGCNQVVSDAPNGARVAGLVTLVTPQEAVVSVWRYNNSTQSFQAGYFADPAAPTDFTLMGASTRGRSTEGYMVCVQRAATIIG